MDQENKSDVIRVEIELSPVKREPSETNRGTQVPEQDPIHSEMSPRKEFPSVITSDRYFSVKQQRIIKVLIFIIVVGVLVGGRSTVPDNEVACVRDKAFEVLEGVTRYIVATPEHVPLRNALQIIASGLIDIIFLLTFGYWIFKGRSSRLIIAFAIFYGTRAVVQHLVWSPFPDMFYWNSPGFPSLVVPYGRGSDFFFSGHSGFLVICMNEWGKLGFRKMKWFSAVVLAYTIFILLVYRIHYTADIFTGVFFADWCYIIVSRYQDKFDKIFISIAAAFRRCFQKLKKKTKGNENAV
jgi:hypothetical protein